MTPVTWFILGVSTRPRLSSQVLQATASALAAELRYGPTVVAKASVRGLRPRRRHHDGRLHEVPSGEEGEHRLQFLPRADVGRAAVSPIIGEGLTEEKGLRLSARH